MDDDFTDSSPVFSPSPVPAEGGAGPDQSAVRSLLVEQDGIQLQPPSWYSPFCNRWVSLIGVSTSTDRALHADNHLNHRCVLNGKRVLVTFETDTTPPVADGKLPVDDNAFEMKR